MDQADFKIGTLFRTGSGFWRCTDVGTRTIAAIGLDRVWVENAARGWTLNQAEAEADRWFNGPPYAVAEFVFDEYDFAGCEPDNLTDCPGETCTRFGADDFAPRLHERFEVASEQSNKILGAISM